MWLLGDWSFLTSPHLAPHPHICAVVTKSGTTLLSQKQRELLSISVLSRYSTGRGDWLAQSVLASIKEGQKGARSKWARGERQLELFLVCVEQVCLSLLCATPNWFLIQSDNWERAGCLLSGVQRSMAGFSLEDAQLLWISKVCKVTGTLCLPGCAAPRKSPHGSLPVLLYPALWLALEFRE